MARLDANTIEGLHDLQNKPEAVQQILCDLANDMVNDLSKQTGEFTTNTNAVQAFASEIGKNNGHSQ
jgi:hypothetical protein